MTSSELNAMTKQELHDLLGEVVGRLCAGDGRPLSCRTTIDLVLTAQDSSWRAESWPVNDKDDLTEFQADAVERLIDHLGFVGSPGAWEFRLETMDQTPSSA